MSLLHKVALTFLKNIGPSSVKSLVSHFGGAEEVFKASAAKWLKAYGVGEKRISEVDRNEALSLAEQELQFVEKNEIEVIFYTDERFPKRLKNCHDSPALLYAKGNANFNVQRVVSIVGTRNATEYGKEQCRQLVEEL